jgi:hypothetical protein
MHRPGGRGNVLQATSFEASFPPFEATGQCHYWIVDLASGLGQVLWPSRQGSRVRTLPAPGILFGGRSAWDSPRS